jgi:hypothetical protein
MFGEILSFAFHLLALAGLYSGVRGLKQLKHVEKAEAIVSPS